MLDVPSQLRLLTGLIKATEEGHLLWESAPRAGIGLASVTTAMFDSINRSKVFRATSRGGALYELSSGDMLSRAPFELRIWESRDGKSRLIDSIRSSTNVGASDEYKVNLQLAELFRVVDDSVESGEEIVDRLLGDLD